MTDYGWRHRMGNRLSSASLEYTTIFHTYGYLRMMLQQQSHRDFMGSRAMSWKTATVTRYTIWWLFRDRSRWGYMLCRDLYKVAFRTLMVRWQLVTESRTFLLGVGWGRNHDKQSSSWTDIIYLFVPKRSFSPSNNSRLSQMQDILLSSKGSLYPFARISTFWTLRGGAENFVFWSLAAVDTFIKIKTIGTDARRLWSYNGERNGFLEVVEWTGVEIHSRPEYTGQSH